MGFLIFMVCVVVFILVFSSVCYYEDTNKKDAIDNLTALAEFVYYCEEHKDELPDNIRKKFDAMEESILKK